MGNDSMNITDTYSESAEVCFLQNIRNIENSAVLLKRGIDGSVNAVYVSDLFAKMMECNESEAIDYINGIGFFNIIHQDDRIFVKRILRRRVSEDGTSELTIRECTTKGNIIWCKVSFSFFDDFKDKYIYCTFFEVTSLREYEEYLRASYMNMGNDFYHEGENTLSMLRADLSEDAVEDIQGRDVSGTDSLVYSYSEIMERRAQNYVVPEEKERFLETFSRENLINTYINGETQISEVVYSRRNKGNYCYIKITANMTRHLLMGNIIAFITEEDCNVEKAGQMILNNILSKEFDTIAYLSNGNYGIIIDNTDNVENDHIYPISKVGEYQLYLDAQVYPVLAGDDKKKNKVMDSLSLDTVERKLANNSSYSVNVAIDVDGNTYYKRFDYYMVNPRAKFYVLLKSDTTDILKEQEERTRQLISALDEAEEANMAKMSFLSSMSSEIMDPLNTIIGLDDNILKEADHSSKVKAGLEEIADRARYMLTLIGDIIEMSDIESGRIELKKEQFAFTDLLDKINDDAGERCRDKGLTYECTVKGDLKEDFYGDQVKIKHALINIISNAVKFTDEGGNVAVQVSKTAEFDNNTVVQFIVSDTGIGIDKEYLPRVFDSFSQKDANTAGSGLGLSIAKKIASLMNGDIAVESEEGRGTTFTLEVKLENAEVKDASGSEEEHAMDLAGKCVLLAEDMIINAELMKQVLVMKGIEVEYAENGRKALEIFEESDIDHFDAILMDIRMPEMDGLAATKAIRELDRADAKKVPIIALTANSFDEDIRKSFKAGMNEHLSKPVEPNVLYKILDEMFCEREHNNN